MLIVNELGNNLNIAIKSKLTYISDWLTFACWYSIAKFLPDAKVSIICSPGIIRSQVFHWPKRCNVPFAISRKPTLATPVLVLPDDAVLVRELSAEHVAYLNSAPVLEPAPEICCEAREEKFVPFVTCGLGCGNFVRSEWVNKDECPFARADQFMTHSATSNEIRILKLWQQINSTYATVSRG